jgi:hypothetical protein
MAINNMMMVSWAWIAAWVFAGAAITVLACILLAVVTERHHARRPSADHVSHGVHELIPPAETGRQHLRHAA